uniref:NADAR domain-containing protein n=1 Tax=Panagrolaimus davidi TaxID=227884 RepID=A0A914Q887_9BILA
MFFYDTKTEHLIMQTSDPKKMKRYGRQVEGFDEQKWNKINLQVMKFAVYYKFVQNSSIRYELFRTLDTTLVETNPHDTYWGIGLSMDDPNVKQKSNWRGHNNLGIILTQLRQFLKFKPEFQDELKKCYAMENYQQPQYCMARSEFLPNGTLMETMNKMGFIDDREFLVYYFNKTISDFKSTAMPSENLEDVRVTSDKVAPVPQYMGNHRRGSCSRNLVDGGLQVYFGRTYYKSRDVVSTSPHSSIGGSTQVVEQNNLDSETEINRMKYEIQHLQRNLQMAQERILLLENQLSELQSELHRVNSTENNINMNIKLQNLNSALNEARIDYGNTKRKIQQFENL